ncbi:MAG: ribose 5-phosphate isomerase B [Chitinispirillaceae bacterium]|nr:ribose 5-phosphate isomerase B [Chitinispirillaceae bacterium]
MKQNEEKMVIAGDHAGYELKEHVKAYLTRIGIAIEDLSAPQLDPSDDYPVFGFKAAKAIADGSIKQGILICGTGIGISIAANRYRGVRAALCTSPDMARMAREHNNANVLVLGGRTTAPRTAEKIIDAWLDGNFAGGRHSRRVDLLDRPPPGV